MICNSRISVCKYSISYMYQEYVVNIHFTVRSRNDMFLQVLFARTTPDFFGTKENVKKNMKVQRREREKEEGPEEMRFLTNIYIFFIYEG